MRSEDFLRSLREEKIVPSETFADRVMSKVRVEAVSVSATRSPWKRLTSSTLFAAIALGVLVVLSSFSAHTLASGGTLNNEERMLLEVLSSTGWVVLSLLLSALAVSISNEIFESRRPNL
jgi:hypothetical protein